MGMKTKSLVSVMLSLIIISACNVCEADQKLNSSIYKKPLGIADVDLESINIDEVIQKGVHQEMHREISATVYILRGSIAPYAEHKTASMTVYDERTVSTNTVFIAKEFLMDVAVSHPNQLTRRLSSITIAYAFPNDEQISEWIFNQYFFGDLNRDDIKNLIKIVSFGRYTHPKAKVFILDCVSRDEIEIFLSAITCISENQELYPEAYASLIPAMISFSERDWNVSDSSPKNIRNITRIMLESAVSRCKESKAFSSEVASFMKE